MYSKLRFERTLFWWYFLCTQNGSPLVQCQTITLTNTDLSIRSLRTNHSDITTFESKAHCTKKSIHHGAFDCAVCRMSAILYSVQYIKMSYFSREPMSLCLKIDVVVTSRRLSSRSMNKRWLYPSADRYIHGMQMGSPLLTLINLNYSMDNQLHLLSSMEWNFLSIPKLQRTLFRCALFCFGYIHNEPCDWSNHIPHMLLPRHWSHHTYLLVYCWCSGTGKRI